MKDKMKQRIHSFHGMLKKLWPHKTALNVFLIYFFFGFIPMLIISFFLMSEMKKLLIEQKYEAEKTELSMILEDVNHNFNTMSNSLQWMYLNDSLEKVAFHTYTNYFELVEDYRDMMAFYDNLSRYYNMIQSIGFYTYNDTIIENSFCKKLTPTVQEEEWYQEEVQRNGRMVWRYRWDENTNESYITLIRRIQDQRENPAGYVMIRMKNSIVVRSIRHRESETYLLLNGTDVVGSNQEEVNQENVLCLAKQFDQEQEGKRKPYVIDYKGQSCLIVKARIPILSSEDYLELISIQPEKVIFKEANQKSRFMGVFTILVLFLSILVVSGFAIRYGHGITKFRTEMQKAASGNFHLKQHIGSEDEIGVLYKQLYRMVEQIQELLASQYQAKVREEQLIRQQKEIEFKVLSNQINPHFLYNSLQTICVKAMCNEQYEIEEMVKMLAKILRRGIETSGSIVSLQSEIDLVECYLKLQGYRFGDRISYEIHLQCEIESYRILPLLIQPIVENCFYHGLEQKKGQGLLTITIYEEDKLYIAIEDNGLGMDEETLLRIRERFKDAKEEDSSHIGITNVNSRIRLHYGEEYGLRIESRQGEGTKVIIELPKVQEF